MAKTTTLDELAGTLDDVAESISDLSTMMSTEFAAVRSEMIDLYSATREDTRQAIAESESRIMRKVDDKVDTSSGVLFKQMEYGIAQLTKGQTELSRRFETQENLLLAVHADIKELYERIDQLRSNTKHMSAEERRRLAELEAFAMQVAEKTGIPFNLKSKRRS